MKIRIQCAFCSMPASRGCADCKAPLCAKHSVEEARQYKCRDHRKRVFVGERVKGEIG